MKKQVVLSIDSKVYKNPRMINLDGSIFDYG